MWREKIWSIHPLPGLKPSWASHNSLSDLSSIVFVIIYINFRINFTTEANQTDSPIICAVYLWTFTYKGAMTASFSSIALPPNLHNTNNFLYKSIFPNKNRLSVDLREVEIFSSEFHTKYRCMHVPRQKEPGNLMLTTLFLLRHFLSPLTTEFLKSLNMQYVECRGSTPHFVSLPERGK